MAKILEREEETKVKFEADDTAEQLEAFMSANPKGHYNNEPDYNYKVSSGSLNLDLAMRGGPQAGIIRLVGLSEGGKSSCALAFVKNFFKLHENSRAILIPSEGNRIENLALSMGELTVTKSAAAWKNHTCFSYRTNIYENAMSIISHMVDENPANTRYIFVVDSIDALEPAGDADKGFEEAHKVAGGALLGSMFGKRMSLKITSRGHLVILISQVRKTDINIAKYAKHEDKLLDGISGGNGLIHYADWILQFQGHGARDDKLWEGEAGKGDPLGHFCEIDFRKAPKNISGKKARYPIKYLSDGNSEIWHSYEIADTLLTFSLAKRKGAWISIGEKTIKDCEEAGFEIQAEHNGLNKFRQYLEDNKGLCEFLLERLKSVIIQ